LIKIFVFSSVDFFRIVAANDNSLWQRHLNQLWCQHSSHPLLIQYRNIAVQLNNTLNFLCLNNEPSIPSFTTLYKITYKVAYFKLLKVIRCCKESADFLTIAMPDVEIVKTLIQFYKEKQFFVVCFQTHLKGKTRHCNFDETFQFDKFFLLLKRFLLSKLPQSIHFIL
jgi:hypothetical protein